MGFAEAARPKGLGFVTKEASFLQKLSWVLPNHKERPLL